MNSCVGGGFVIRGVVFAHWFEQRFGNRGGEAAQEVWREDMGGHLRGRSCGRGSERVRAGHGWRIGVRCFRIVGEGVRFTCCSRKMLVVRKVASGSMSAVRFGIPELEADRHTPADLLVRSVGCKLWADSDQAPRWQWVDFLFFRVFLGRRVLYRQQR